MLTTMTIRPLSRDEVRGIDARAARELGMPTVILMENAGRGAAAWLRDLGLPAAARVLILCGPGNNGGDGAVVARHLDLRGVSVQVVWFTRADRLRGDAAIQYQILARSGFDQTCRGEDDEASVAPDRLDALIAGADWLVDALLGTGLTRPVEGMLRSVIEAINRSGKPVLALDLPSGLDADTGQPLGVSVRARATATFVAPKLGFAAPGADSYTGEVAVIDIGLPRALLAPYFLSAAR
jgi:NAD(P)H-hydrate epimerase